MEDIKQIELGSKDIGSLLKQYAIPGIISMTAVSLYNMVDSIYIGHMKDVGPMAISGLAITFPFMNLITAISTLIGIGSATVLSILLGQNNHKAANKVLGNSIFLSILIGGFFSILSLVFLDKILYVFGAGENTIMYARDYMKYILAGGIISNMYLALIHCKRASGHPATAMMITLFTIILNCILDPIFIFSFGLGTKGAAMATVLSQIFPLMFLLKSFIGKNKPLRIESLSPDFKIVKKTISIGLGPFLMNAAACIVTLFVNQQMKKYGGDLQIGAYGIVNRILILFVMIIIGLNQGMQPIAGYNFGARKYGRLIEVYKKTVFYASLISVASVLMAFSMGDKVVMAFTDDPYLIKLASKGLKTVNFFFWLIGFQMVSTMFFQCMGMVKKSIFLSLSRQLIFLVPLTYILPLFLKTEGVWISYTAADLLASTVTAIMVIRLINKLRKMKDGDSYEQLSINV